MVLASPNGMLEVMASRGRVSEATIRTPEGVDPKFVSDPDMPVAKFAAPDRILLAHAGGYAFGLGITQSCEFDHIVAHSGGLPGYGSMMRWLPSYGVGVIAFGNVTYTGWGGVGRGKSLRRHELANVYDAIQSRISGN